MAEIFVRESSLLTFELRLFFAVIALYAMSCVFNLLQIPLSAVRRSFTFGKIGTWLLYLAFAAHTMLVLVRYVEQGQPPVQNKYECLSWFAWSTVFTYIYVRRWWPQLSMPGIFVTALSVAALSLAINKYDPAVTPLAPALQSPWYFWHVLIAFGAYAVFVVGCSVEMSYLIMRGFGRFKRTWEDFGLPSQDVDVFHRLSYKLILIGFPLLTFGIVSGAAWADEAWGRYWSWDPFEILSLITWTAFAMYLHAMNIPRWRETGGSALCILGFTCMLITFMGAGFLTKLFGLYSMHAY